MLACGGVYNGQRLLSQSGITKAKGIPGTYGYGFFNTLDDSYFVAGGMYGQTLYIFPVVVLHGHGVACDGIVPLYL